MPDNQIPPDEVADVYKWLTVTISPQHRDTVVIAVFNYLAQRAHICAVSKGHWDATRKPKRNDKYLLNPLYRHVDEAESQLRIGNAQGAGLELAQLLLKVSDLRALTQWDIGRSVLDALSHNANQPAVKPKENKNESTESRQPSYRHRKPGDACQVVRRVRRSRQTTPNHNRTQLGGKNVSRDGGR